MKYGKKDIILRSSDLLASPFKWNRDSTSLAHAQLKAPVTLSGSADCPLSTIADKETARSICSGP